jgi:oxygen-independent coproporphyrinogen-3 oxidase
MFLGLRMTDGISEEVFAKTFGKTADEVYGDVIRKQTEQGMLERSGGRLFFTERGVDISNTLMAEYMF